MCETGFRQGIHPHHPKARMDSKRINGNHHIFTKEGHQERMVIPVHRNQPLKIGLLKHQMKIAGLTESDL